MKKILLKTLFDFLSIKIYFKSEITFKFFPKRAKEC